MIEQPLAIPSKRAADSHAVKLLHTISLIRHHLLFIILTTICVIVLTAVYVFSLPREYSSDTTLLPETSSDGISGNLGQLASLAGVKVGGKSEDAIYPEFYPKVTGSTVFLADMLKEKVYCTRLGKRVSVFDYFQKYQQKPWWGNLFGEKEKPVASKINPVCITREQMRVVKALSNAFFCSVDKKTDMVSVSVKVQDADVAAQIADAVRKRLQTYITDYRTNKARKDLEYTKKITREARDQYIKSQQKYAAYCDANEDIMLASFTQVRDRLENEMQMAYNMYQQSTQQMQLAQAKLQERTPVFVTIQPAYVPSKPSAPKRGLTLVMMFMIAVFGSIAWIMAKDYYDSKLKNVERED